MTSTSRPRAYSVGDDVELTFTVGSSQSTEPESASVHLVITDPLAADARYTTANGLTKSVPSSDSTSEGWARWQGLFPANKPGRWTFQFTSTGTVRTSMGGAYAVARPLASTST